jgi:hypothetical protein
LNAQTGDLVARKLRKIDRQLWEGNRETGFCPGNAICTSEKNFDQQTLPETIHCSFHNSAAKPGAENYLS